MQLYVECGAPFSGIKRYLPPEIIAYHFNDKQPKAGPAGGADDFCEYPGPHFFRYRFSIVVAREENAFFGSL